jgi:hypothetical protein
MLQQPDKDRTTTPPKGNDVLHIVTKRVLRGGNYYACVAENGFVDYGTISFLKKDSIAKMLHGVNPKLNWRWFKRKGWSCIKVRVAFKHGW